ncbi:MAG: RNA degradosome polyphosphate kinase, partial [Solirubrobacterales bacterium]
MSAAPARPSRYLNRELSWLAFNARVLHEAEDVRTPLLERVKFLAILASNLDEFYMVRVAGLRRQRSAGVQQLDAEGRSPAEQLAAIVEAVRRMLARARRTLHEELIP